MNLGDFHLPRRGFLLAPLAAAAAVTFGPRRAAAQEKATLLAKAVERVPEAPDDAAWEGADVLPVPLAPQVVVKPRLYEAGVTAVTVRALYDADRLALLFEWEDPRANTELAGVADFRDAVAVEFPADPTAGIPYFAMGEPGKPVTIYQWKADWQFSRDHDVTQRHPDMIDDWYPFSGRPAGEIAGLGDYAEDRIYLTSAAVGSLLSDIGLQARTPVEKLQAEGFGTLTPVEVSGQDGAGTAAAAADGRWRVVISVPRQQPGFTFAPGMTLPMAFALWDGARAERGGEKAVSTWYFVSLERPVGNAIYWAPIVAAAGVLAAQLGGLRVLKRRAQGKRSGGDEGQG
ncbi:MAG: hypothetical protein D6754_16380 [Alphaproteobacteria bacterium]|nr:MAG: hypothetical protein D6754_16380 [Alphaproteobacteria bacterium]